MRIVLAFDKFKGSLTAEQACAAAATGLRNVQPNAELVSKPMADGGDGTAAVLHSVLGGAWRQVTVTGPLPERRVQARYLWLKSERTAVIEMASASGLVLLGPRDRNPLRTTTFGTGELIRDAISQGARQILLCVGGSATVDGGVGAAQALGWQFLAANGHAIGPGGGSLAEITRILSPNPSPGTWPEISVLCDVDNPLCGPRRAARVFGPQKGASPALVEELEQGLSYLADLVRDQRGVNLHQMRGAGAAGGLAGGAVAFLGGKLVSGIETIISLVGMPQALRGADWLLTGEGQFDESSLGGKVVGGVIGLARPAGVKVAVLAGGVALSEPAWRAAGVTDARAIRPAAMGLPEAMRQARGLLQTTAEQFATQWICPSREQMP